MKYQLINNKIINEILEQAASRGYQVIAQKPAAESCRPDARAVCPGPMGEWFTISVTRERNREKNKDISQTAKGRWFTLGYQL